MQLVCKNSKLAEIAKFEFTVLSGQFFTGQFAHSSCKDKSIALIMDVRTTEILRLFHSSWEETENFYDDLISNYPGCERLKPLRSFITKLKETGENNFFRIGTSMHALMISRSLQFRLRDDQKYIRIEVIKTNDIEVIFRDGATIYREYRVNSFDGILIFKLLMTLKDTLVD